MSAQWETAKHCHMSLSVLAAKIKQTPGGADSHSQVYATRGSPTLGESLHVREERRRKLSGQSPVPENHPNLSEGANFENRGHQLNESNIDHTWRGEDSTWDQSAQVLNGSEYGTLAETPYSLHMTFQDTNASQFEGVSNFDLNMVDLIQGANFDSLFDLTGQQYPSF